MLGILLVQDVIVIIALSALVNVENFTVFKIGGTLVNAIGLLILAMLISKYVLGHLFRKIAESRELLFMFGLAWAMLFAGLSEYIGFSIVIGAFIAGISLATFPYSTEIIGQIKPLKTFFVTIFFVSIGLQIGSFNLSGMLIPVIVFLLVATLLKPFIISIVSSLFKYSRKTAFKTGIGLGQISEFSLILAAQGLALGILSESFFSTIILTAVFSMTLTPYLINYDDKLFSVFGRAFTFLNKNSREKGELEHVPKDLKNHVVVCGGSRTGAAIIAALQNEDEKFIVTDYNPAVIENLLNRRIPCVYGDVEDSEVLEKIKLQQARLVVSTTLDHEANLYLIREIKKKNRDAIILMVTGSIDDAFELYKAGADYVILPQLISGERLSDILKNFRDKKIIDVLRMKQVVELEKIKEQGIGNKDPHPLAGFIEKFRL